MTLQDKLAAAGITDDVAAVLPNIDRVEAVWTFDFGQDFVAHKKELIIRLC